MKIKEWSPESLMMTYGYDPERGEGSVKAPLYQTSTFSFRSAEEGKAFFELAYQLRPKQADENMGFMYSRINNPNLELFEQRLCLWDKAEEGAVFESGMAAISTVLLEFLKPGDTLLYSAPLYGGTDHFINHYLPQLGIAVVGFSATDKAADILLKLRDQGRAESLAMIYVETPGNPTNAMIDLALCRQIINTIQGDQAKALLVVDNTFMGPLWSHPLQLGADLVLYSATKYIGGHSDLIAGAVLGSGSLIRRVKTLRTFLGNMASPFTCWLLLRSLETLKVRMEQQMENAKILARFLSNHPLVEQVYYLGLLQEGTSDFDLYQRQYEGPGAMISFDIHGGEKEAFRFLNNLKLFKLAVSLGSTESLAQHPASMTHAGVPKDQREKMGISDKLVRLSIGLEQIDDLIQDVDLALANTISSKPLSALASLGLDGV